MKALWLIVFLLTPATMVRGAQESSLRLDFSNPDLVPARWTLVVHPDGSGHFHAERGDAQGADSATIEPVVIDRDVQLSGTFAGQLFQILRHHPLQAGQCESRSKVAFQGWKKLEYSGPNGVGACEFNFAKDREIGAVADSLIAVAATLIEGARLEMILVHDPLGLDKEMDYLTEAAGDGRLLQIRTIRNILLRLGDDSTVMERVRRRAEKLAECQQ